MIRRWKWSLLTYYSVGGGLYLICIYIYTYVYIYAQKSWPMILAVANLRLQALLPLFLPIATAKAVDTHTW